MAAPQKQLGEVAFETRKHRSWRTFWRLGRHKKTRLWTQEPGPDSALPVSGNPACGGSSFVRTLWLLIADVMQLLIDGHLFWGQTHPILVKDYVITQYIAEFINTLSSLVFAAYGMWGLWQIRHKANAASRSIPYFGLIGVGICSTGYHMTLKYHTQMSDEFSMHLLTTPLLYRVMTYKTDAAYTRRVGIILSALFAIVITTHMVMDEFLLHATSFGLAVYLLAAGSLKIISKGTDESVKGIRRKLVMFGLLNFVIGYLAWLIDSFACLTLTRMRESVGLPWAFLFEFHGWWHVLTAIGGYTAVATLDAVTSDEAITSSTTSFAWPVPMAVSFFEGGEKAAKKG
ncbi:alkaline ceramidase family protein [Grosmannia clavigera kw1407]|uniref:Alkaline ceramidase family protein n=1 Tax=Grosmannia clavigera (strain kw1407 / UAMH 11150) TaxID=655863 RepID=F0XSU7_GROCL|nr:alkaline ceramidase family protein [Grosmannia clavigera kw1407]EFW99283.1 alkaline ceramidase family protein [Grosmannia clavigera kw1407]